MSNTEAKAHKWKTTAIHEMRADADPSVLCVLWRVFSAREPAAVFDTCSADSRPGRDPLFLEDERGERLEDIFAFQKCEKYLGIPSIF